MKVIHVLKRIEMIDQDIRELRKLEKSLQRNKSFTQPIFITIEKQINILLGERIKLLELKIANPPANLQPEEEEVAEPLIAEPKKKTSKKKEQKENKIKEAPMELEEQEFSMLTQDDIDKKIAKLKEEDEAGAKKEDDDTAVKLLDIALEKGTINKQEVETQKKKIRFFKDNFPGGEY
ncbi:MAG: hypothetical protein N3F66_04475 [Spirochaetes bacterium]|nr:hypothetical protein [Spirochaetota bacterium]